MRREQRLGEIKNNEVLQMREINRNSIYKWIIQNSRSCKNTAKYIRNHILINHILINHILIV
jgi:hypothetical protein